MYSIYGCPMHYGVGDEGLMFSLDYLNQRYDVQIPVTPETTAIRAMAMDSSSEEAPSSN